VLILEGVGGERKTEEEGAGARLALALGDPPAQNTVLPKMKRNAEKFGGVLKNGKETLVKNLKKNGDWDSLRSGREVWRGRYLDRNSWVRVRSACGSQEKKTKAVREEHLGRGGGTSTSPRQ